MPDLPASTLRVQPAWPAAVPNPDPRDRRPAIRTAAGRFLLGRRLAAGVDQRRADQGRRAASRAAPAATPRPDSAGKALAATLRSAHISPGATHETNADATERSADP